MGDSLLTHGTSVLTNVAQSTVGTKEDVECNNRGKCDNQTGVCTCALDYASSDGMGNIGTTGDCGALDQHMSHGEF